MPFVEKSETRRNLRFSRFGTGFAEYPTTDYEEGNFTMYDRKFFRSQLGQASLASFAAMAIFAVFSSNVALNAPAPSVAAYEQVSLA